MKGREAEEAGTRETGSEQNTEPDWDPLPGAKEPIQLASAAADSPPHSLCSTSAQKKEPV